MVRASSATYQSHPIPCRSSVIFPIIVSHDTITYHVRRDVPPERREKAEEQKYDGGKRARFIHENNPFRQPSKHQDRGCSTARTANHKKARSKKNKTTKARKINPRSRFHHDEDKLLCRAYVAVATEEVKGADLDPLSFWEKVLEKYSELVPQERKAQKVYLRRNALDLQNRFERGISRQMLLFNKYYLQQKATIREGWTEKDYVQASVVHFNSVENGNFQHADCVELLHTLPEFSPRSYGADCGTGTSATTTQLQALLIEDPAGSMEDRLRKTLLDAGSSATLPMDMSLFYQAYILNQGCDVKESSYHTVANWLLAMEREGLVLLRKQVQTNRNYRKGARSKTIVAIGKKDVRHHRHGRPTAHNSLTNKRESTGSEHPSANTVSIVSNHGISIQHPKARRLTPKEADEKLAAAVESIPQDQLPMDQGNFFQQCCTLAQLPQSVHQSCCKSVSDWIINMEKQGMVLTKNKRVENRKDTITVVVASGASAVNRMLGKAAVTAPQPAGADSARKPRFVTNEDLRNAATSSFKSSRHALDRQKQRLVSNSDVEAVLTSKTTHVTRSRDGIKTYVDTDSGVTAVVTGRGKQIVTTWKEDVAESRDLSERWSMLNSKNVSVDRKGWVTVSETYVRAEKEPGKHSKWKIGDLIRRKRCYRLNLLVVGLDEPVANDLKKQIQNRMGCRCSVGVFDLAKWQKLHPDVDPLDAEGRATLSTQVRDHRRNVSNILKMIEPAVPRQARRYLRENFKEALAGNSVIEEVEFPDQSSRALELVQHAREELVRLYSEHAPEKVKGIEPLLLKYAGKEDQLAGAVKAKYSQNELSEDKSNLTAYGGILNVPKSATKRVIRAENIFGESEGEDWQDWDGHEEPYANREDSMIYF